MSNIKHMVYESLTPRQRIIASIEALARGDEEEKSRLVESCPKKNYRQNDAEFADKMGALMTLMLAVECDLRGSVLGFFLALRTEPKSVHEILQNIADIQAAWEEFISSLGIDPETMAKAAPPFGAFLELIDGLLPDPDHDNVEIKIDNFNEIFD